MCVQTCGLAMGNHLFIVATDQSKWLLTVLNHRAYAGPYEVHMDVILLLCMYKWVHVCRVMLLACLHVEWFTVRAHIVPQVP